MSTPRDLRDDYEPPEDVDPREVLDADEYGAYARQKADQPRRGGSAAMVRQARQEQRP